MSAQINGHITEQLAASIDYERMKLALQGCVMSLKAIQKKHPDVVLTRDWNNLLFAEETLKKIN